MSTQLINNIKEFNQILNELKQNPLFYAFGENKENFHSSFWKWMFHENPKETIRILTDCDEKDDLEYSIFKREQNSSYTLSKDDNESSFTKETYKARYDVLISINEVNKYIIETKVKSFPTIEQLERIELATKNKNEVKFLCIHLYPTESIENIVNELRTKWTFVEFKSIADRINIDKFENNAKIYVQDYKKMLLSLSSLFKLFSFDKEKPEYDFIWDNAKNQNENFNFQAKLEEYKLWELFLHYRSKHFFQKLKNAIETNDNFDNKLVFECSINNKKSTISIGYILDGDTVLNKNGLNYIDRNINKFKKDTKIIGIQIEDDQFRQFVLASKDSETILRNMKEKHFFNDSHPLQKGKDYCKYGETFKYRYEKIKTYNFDEISKMIIDFLTKIKEIQSELLIVK
jgi:hypothetical protein